MIKSDHIETGIGDIDGTIRVQVTTDEAVGVLSVEWARLRTQAIGGVFLAVRDTRCPFEASASVAFDGTYQLLLALQTALVKSGRDGEAIFEFEPRLTQLPQPSGWEFVTISGHADVADGFAEEIERALHSSSRPPYGELVSHQQSELTELRRSGSATLVLHTRNRLRLERLLKSRGHAVEFSARMLSEDEVRARNLNIAIHAPALSKG